MPSQESSLDLLRPGVLLSENFKLLERIPRWVASRRFLAEHAGQRVQLLFFSEASDNPEAWVESLALLQELKHEAVLPVLSIENVRGFQFLVAREVRGPSLRELLDEEGVMDPGDAQELVAGLRSALRALQKAGLPSPAIVPENILVGDNGKSLCPSIFPWPLSGFPATPPAEISLRLRDLLYLATTNITPPQTYHPRDLLALPAPVRRHWQPVFADVPDWSALDAWSPAATRAVLPPSKPGAAEPAASRMGKRPDFTPAVRDPVPQRRPPNGWPVVSSVAALAAAGAVVWFSYELVQSIRQPRTGPFAQSDFLLPGRAPALAPDLRTVADGSAPPPEPSLPARGEDISEADAQLEQETGKVFPPPDAPGEPGANLVVWYERWQSRRDDKEFTEQFNRYLRGLTPHADAMRSGRLPLLLQQLQDVTNDGPPAAGFLLGQVLWGRETERSEQLMRRLAREGYEPARSWCDEQFIDWK